VRRGLLAWSVRPTLPPWTSDALCRLSTGGGFSARELYTDAEECLFDATRPVILNGITDVATRPDLLDRSLIITLPPIPEEQRKPEAELWRDFEQARPAILGALFYAVSGALGTVEDVRLEGMPRMADFALWATAAEEALGLQPGAFMEAYAGNRREATESALEADPVASAVREFMDDHGEWSGTAAQLWKAPGDLVDEDIEHTKAWPGAPNALSGRLKRLAPALRGVGIECGDARLPGTGKRVKSLKKIAEQDRHDRHAQQKDPQNGRAQRDDGVTTPASGQAKTVTDEGPAKQRVRDDGDGRDDDSRPHSKEGSSWASDPMRHYDRGAGAS
jgi:hypothetical protein